MPLSKDGYKLINRIRVHAGVTVRMVPQLGVDVGRDRVEMKLHNNGVLIDQGKPFGIKLIPFANIYEIDFVTENGSKE
jgi:hypothetical protein